MRMLRESANRRNAVRLRDNSAIARVLCRLEACSTEQARMPVLQYLIPLVLVFEHDFPEQTDGRHSVAEQFVMKFLQREIVTLLRLVVVPQFQDLQFAEGVIQITWIERGSQSFLARRLLFVVTVVLKKF